MPNFERRARQEIPSQRGEEEAPLREIAGEAKEKKENLFLKALDGFRQGKLGKLGRMLAFVALFGPIPELLRGISWEKEEVVPSPQAEAKLTPEEINELKARKPDVLEVGENDIWLGYGGTRDELKAGVESEIVANERAQVDQDVYFTWGGREFKDAKLLAEEEKRLEETLRPRIEKLLGPYREFGVEKYSIQRIVIDGSVFSSPEGHKYPQANLELSQRRAAFLESILKNILKDLEVDENLIKLKVEGQGAQGDVLEMSTALEKLGYNFRTPSVDTKAKDPLDPRRDEVESVIRNIHDGNFASVLTRLPKEYQDPDLMFEIYKNLVASKRVGKVSMSIETKPVHLGVAKKAPETTKKVLATIWEMGRPEEWEERAEPRPKIVPVELPPEVPPERQRFVNRVEEWVRKGLPGLPPQVPGGETFIPLDNKKALREMQRQETERRVRTGTITAPYKRVQSSGQHSGGPFFRTFGGKP